MLSEPEDYGLTPEATLAHTIAGDPPEGFEAFWGDLREDVAACPLGPVAGRFDDGDGEITLRSVRGVRILGRLHLPENGSPRAAVLSLHGANPAPTFDGDFEDWTAAGLAVLELRVRGYPPSTGDLQPAGAWIHEGIDAPEAWIVRGAVADVAVAARAVRHAFPDLPLTIRGESLGGGLAVMGAAQLTRLGVPPTQLLIGLPTFGDWAWRERHFVNGLGGQVNMLLHAYRSDELEELRQTLAMFDAAWHAREVQCPTVCKLALRDDTVPAPTAAAVFNGLGSAERRAYVVAYGHFDGGITDLRRHASFERLSRALATDPDPALALWTRVGLRGDDPVGLVNSACVREMSKI